MGDQQRVRPVPDVEAAAATSSYEKGNQSVPQAIPNNTSVINPRPIIHQNNQGRRNLCCKCLCWMLSLLIIILIVLGITVAVLYFVFHPRLPDYQIDSLRVNNLRINYDLTLYVEFNVKITASNPNEKIGIYYEKGGRLGVWYAKTELCEGPIPRFYQGYRNRTKLEVVLTGNAQYGNTIMSALQQQQQTGRVPLDLKVEAPVALRLGRLKLRKVRILGDCKVVVDSLSANYKISIKASNCSFAPRL